jgi:predicted Fe-S protein YdhL (DUF1289 family)
MTPHPVAAWVQMTVSPQRHVVARQRRRRRAVLLARADRARRDGGSSPTIPAQRRPVEDVESRSIVWRRR